MKTRTYTPGQQTADPAWNRVIEQIKTLNPDQQLKLADNIRTGALTAIKSQQEELRNKLSQLDSLVGAGEQQSEQSSGSATRDKIFNALRRGPMTVRQIQEATGAQWVNTALSQLVQNQKVVTDGKRPATYSLAR